MRKNETREFQENMDLLGLSDRVVVRDESKRFLAALSGVTAPEKKREIIGKLFVAIQSEAMQELGVNNSGWLLGQGTIYPDTIESGGADGRAAKIKTHHNRCEEILQMLAEGRVIEPVREFYKDEVRRIGKALGLSGKLTQRWPFPGPGLAIRCLCRDSAVPGGLSKVELQPRFGEYTAYHVPIMSVGVQGDSRTYRDVVALSGPVKYRELESLSAWICNLSAKHNRVILKLAGPDDMVGELEVKSASISPARIELLRNADHVVREVLERERLAESVWQFPVVLIPLCRRIGETVVLRPVNSTDGMTASFARLPVAVLEKMSAALMKLDGVGSVFLDVTHKPPATIEWE